jgi:hypothetical protein
MDMADDTRRAMHVARELVAELEAHGWPALEAKAVLRLLEEESAAPAPRDRRRSVRRGG